MNIVQVNETAARGSHGVIAEAIGQLVIDGGGRSMLAFGRAAPGMTSSELVRVGNRLGVFCHGLETRMFDGHGLGSRGATARFVRELERFGPDLVHLHNIHGYWLNYPRLFEWLRAWGGPVVWTLHDCWAFTGHCAHFMGVGCGRWQRECHHCPLKGAYPASAGLDRSRRNFKLKRECFTSLGNRLTLVSCSEAIADYARKSFFKDTRIEVIHNGVDIGQFRPSAPKEKMILGVASTWGDSKGLGDFGELRRLLPADWDITLVGLTPKQIKALPEGIEGIERTANRAELARLYSRAAVFVNPTYEDNFPTVNLEALACGTPVVTYHTGGSPEAIDDATGIVVEQGDIAGLARAIEAAAGLSPQACRERAEKCFDARERYAEYVNLYNELT